AHRSHCRCRLRLPDRHAVRRNNGRRLGVLRDGPRRRSRIPHTLRELCAPPDAAADGRASDRRHSLAPWPALVGRSGRVLRRAGRHARKCGAVRSSQEQPVSGYCVHVPRGVGGNSTASPRVQSDLTPSVSRSVPVVRLGAGIAGCARTNAGGDMSLMRRREFLLIAASTVSAIGLAACQQAAPAAPTAAPAAPAAKPTTPPAAAPTTAPATVAPTAAAAGKPTTAPAPAAGGGTLVYGLSGDFDDTLDPQVTNFDTSIRVTLNICEPLVWEPEPGKFVPGLAEKWDVSPDAKTYTFNLKKGVKFHDGTPFNGAAVKFTLDRIVDPATKAGQSHDQLGPYDHTEVVDDYTIKVVMKQPYAPLLTNMNGYLGIVSPTAVQKMGLAEFARHPVGSGPFIFKEWVPKDHVTLVKNPDYNWGSS